MASPRQPPAPALDLSAEVLQRLETELEQIEATRARAYRNLIAGYMSALLAAPVLIVVLAVCGKYGLLAFLKPAAAWVGAKLAPFTQTMSSSYRSRRALSRLIIYIGSAIVMAPIWWVRHRLKGAYNRQVIPLVFRQLAIPYTQPGTLNLKALKPLYRKKPEFMENPLSVEGTLSGLPVKAHLASLLRLEHDWFDSSPNRVTLFEGVVVQLTLPHPAPMALVLTFEKTYLADGKLQPVPLPDAAHEAAYSAYSDNPQQAANFLSPAFLTDLMASRRQNNDLPRMEICLAGTSLVLFLPDRSSNWLASCRISMSARNLEPIHTMLRSWNLLQNHLTTLQAYHPELFNLPPSR